MRSRQSIQRVWWTSLADIFTLQSMPFKANVEVENYNSTTESSLNSTTVMGLTPSNARLLFRKILR
jgi:hypothetical protein